MRKFLGKAAVEASPSSIVDHQHQPTIPSNLGATGTFHRPKGSQDASLDVGSPIDCLDRSPDGHSAILAGRHVLKTVTVHGASVQPGIDLRAAILAQPTVKNSAVSVSDQLSIKDVKWLKGRGDTTIFTACANGKIFQYDLTRLGGGADGAPMEVIHMREDSRQINTLDINPRSSKMLAGSQDGIVRCFDIMNPVRTSTGHLTYRAVQSFKCNAGGIQCLRWSPNIEGAFYFACATDQGVMLKWDIRKTNAPVLRIAAHDGPCTSMAWHADGDHLVTGGRDRKCHVWDVSATAEKRQKPKTTISAPASVGDLAWRPATWSALAQGRRSAQLAVTYDEGTRQSVNMCHIWDLGRPTMPFKKMHNFDAPPSALLWCDKDLLWTVGNDGLFNQFDIAYAPRMTDQVPASVFSFSSRGEVVAFLDERPQVRRPLRSMVSADILSPLGSSTFNTPMLGNSMSDSEDDVTGSFLGIHSARPKQRRPVTAHASVSRSAQTLSTTPPGGPDGPILALDQSLRATGFHRSSQAMVVGRMPFAAKVPIYEYLSTHYLETLYDMLPYRKGAASLPDRVLGIMHRYAQAAETIGQFRLAQTWRVLALEILPLLARRAQYHVDLRNGDLKRSENTRRKSLELSPPKDRNLTTATHARGSDIALGADKAGGLRSLLTEEWESTSNVPTPLARPVDDYEMDLGQANYQFQYDKKLTPVQEGQSFTLPPPIWSTRRRLDSEPISTGSNDSDAHASTEGYDFYDTETISKAIDVPSSKENDSSMGSVRMVVARHDSNDSFGQIFSISNSSSRQTSQLAGTTPVSVRRHPVSTSVHDQQPRAAPSTSTGGEYEGRIRGATMKETSSPSHDEILPVPEKAATSPSVVKDKDEDEDDCAMPTQTTQDSIDSQKGEMHPKPDRFPPDSSQTASGVVSPSRSFEFRYAEPGQPQETDYLPWSDDPSYPHPLARQDEPPRSGPLSPLKTVSRALHFETKSSALNASAIILLLGPLIRCDTTIDPFLAKAVIKQHHARLMSLKLFTQAAILRKLCVKGWPGGALTEFGDDFPGILSAVQGNFTAALACATCHKPREIDRRTSSRDIQQAGPNPIWQCDSCAAVAAPCAICLQRDVAEPITSIAADEAQQLSTWCFCPTCGHGGHASCMQVWHTAAEDEALLYSDGCCPFDGCGHACLPGKYSAEEDMKRTDEVVQRAVRLRSAGATISNQVTPRFGKRWDASREGNLHGDGTDVPQSKAVESAREVLGGAGGGAGGLRHVASMPLGRVDNDALFGSSPGREGGERERRRSVRFAGSTRGD
ncbi:unnamed protein product [Discula destructiva]